MNIEPLQLVTMAGATMAAGIVVGFVGGLWVGVWGTRKHFDAQIRQHEAWRQQAEKQVHKEGEEVSHLGEAFNELNEAIVSKDEKKVGEYLTRARELVGSVANHNELLGNAVRASAPSVTVPSGGLSAGP